MSFMVRIKNWLNRAQQNVALLLWPVLIILLLLEIFVIRQSVSILLASRQVAGPVKTQLVRVNFTLYDGLVERLKDQAGFQATPVTAQSPFGQGTSGK